MRVIATGGIAANAGALAVFAARAGVIAEDPAAF
jgi:hypothetical protein